MRARHRQGPRRGPAAQPGQVRHRGVALIPDLPDLSGAGVIGIGVDVVDVDRFSVVLQRSPRFVPRVFTPREVAATSAGRPDSLAARWAAKEAVAKVLVDCRGLQWHDCEILTGDRGEPILELSGTVAAAARARAVGQWHVSLSHDGRMAIAFVVATRAVSGA